MRPVHHISVSLGCDFGVPILLDVAKVVVDHARRQCSPPEEGGELMKRREMKAALLPSALLKYSYAQLRCIRMVGDIEVRTTTMSDRNFWCRAFDGQIVTH